MRFLAILMCLSMCGCANITRGLSAAGEAGENYHPNNTYAQSLPPIRTVIRDGNIIGYQSGNTITYNDGSHGTVN